MKMKMYLKKNSYMLSKQLLDLNIVKEKVFFCWKFVSSCFLVSHFSELFTKIFLLCVFIILCVFQLHTYLYKDKLEIFTIVNIHLNESNKCEYDIFTSIQQLSGWKMTGIFLIISLILFCLLIDKDRKRNLWVIRFLKILFWNNNNE